MAVGSYGKGKAFIPFDRLYTFQRNVYADKVEFFKENPHIGMGDEPITAIPYNPHNGEKGCHVLTSGNHRAVALLERGLDGIEAFIEYPETIPPRSLRKLRYMTKIERNGVPNGWIRVGLEK